MESMQAFRRKWEQCGSMTQLNDYNQLIDRINEIQQDGNKWFYIGYTNRLGDDLWMAGPQNAHAIQMIGNLQLDKTHTYYTHLAGVAGQNENNLINMFVQNGAIRCLNVQPFGNEDIQGIVYCLVYQPQQP